VNIQQDLKDILDIYGSKRGHLHGRSLSEICVGAIFSYPLDTLLKHILAIVLTVVLTVPLI